MCDQVKYALVTGASSGIGWHIALELSKHGYAVVAISNDENGLIKLKEVLTSNHGSCITMVCDLATPSAPQTVFDFCLNGEYEIDVLVNNAGILVHGELVNVEKNRASALLQLHVHTPALLCKLFGERMAKAGHGHILNVSSISAVMPYPTISLYGPSKTLLRNFSRALKMEMKPLGVSVTCLMPGATATSLYDAEKVNIPLAKKLGVMQSAEYVANAGVNAMFRGKAESIPGVLNWLIVLLVRFVPHFVVGWVYRRTK